MEVHSIEDPYAVHYTTFTGDVYTLSTASITLTSGTLTADTITDGTLSINSGNVTLGHTNWIGLGAAKGRIQFIDAATDLISISLADIDTFGNFDLCQPDKTLTGGQAGGLAGVNFIFYGDTNGKYIQWDQANDKLNVSGDVAVTGLMLAADGLEAAPSYTFDTATGRGTGFSYQYTSYPILKLSVDGALKGSWTSSSSVWLNTEFTVKRISNTTPPRFILWRLRTSPYVLSNGDVLGQFRFRGYDGGSHVYTAEIIATTTQQWSSGNAGTKLDFYTTPDDSDTAVIALTLDEDGSAIIPVGCAKFDTSVDSSAVANQVAIGGYELSAGNRALAISQESAVAAEVDETKFSHKLPVRINGATYYIMLTDS